MASCFILSRRLLSTTHTNFSNVFNHVTIIGGGLMGSGIAQVTAQSGMDVTIIEVNEEAVKKSDASIKNSMQRVAKKLFQNSSSDADKYISETMGRLKISMDLNEAVSKTDLVVEAIVENLDAKHRLFSKIDNIAPERTIFASNTSSLPISDIAAVTNRKDRFGGLHFFNPVPVMKLLEVVRTNETSEDTYQKMMAWGKAIGKTTITCKDTPGFVVNRLLVPYLAEAARMLERGEATPKDIDVAMKLGAGYPMGPLELLDYVGLDTTKFILDGWHKKYPNNPLFAPIALLDRLVSEGKLGKKTGEGFYSYKKSGGFLPLHSPYFHPLPQPVGAAPTPTPVQQHPPEPAKEQNAEKVKKLKFEKVEAAEQTEDPEQLARMERMEKLKRLERIKNLDKWKNSDDFVKHEREKQAGRRQAGRRSRHADAFGSREMLRASEKLKNLEDFIKFERERDFRIAQETAVHPPN